MPNYVLVHGAWHGGWCWSSVAAGLEGAGHQTYAPTLTGLAERSHLLSAQVGLSTHVQDVVTLIEFHDLREVVLVGHSYAGMVVTAAASQLRERVHTLVVIDGFLPEVGEAAIELLPQQAASHYQEAAAAGDGVGIPPRPLENLGVTDSVVADTVAPLLTPHPLRTYLDASDHGAAGLGIDGLYILCAGWRTPFTRFATHAEDLGWVVRRVDADHEVMVTNPAILVEHLLSVIDSTAPLPEPRRDGAVKRDVAPEMEFLVRQSNRLGRTPEGQELRKTLVPAERKRAQELRDAGVLVRLWRVPGTNDAVGLYRAPDATALHDVLASLPMFPWLDIVVEPLATHPQEQLILNASSNASVNVPQQRPDAAARGA